MRLMRHAKAENRSCCCACVPLRMISSSVVLRERETGPNNNGPTGLAIQLPDPPLLLLTVATGETLIQNPYVTESSGEPKSTTSWTGSPDHSAP
jgi:hypothetical protein